MFTQQAEERAHLGNTAALVIQAAEIKALTEITSGLNVL